MNPKEQVQLVPYLQQSFRLGINTAKAPELLNAEEAVDILNFEYDLEDHLSTRAGVQPFFSTKFPKRITSLHFYANDAGNTWVLITSENQLYANTITGTTPTNITNTLVLPNNKFWQWVNFAGLAIGVNQATTGDNPIKVSGAVPTVGALGGTPPKGKYIVLWNERVWIASAVDPNTVFACKLGDPEDWTDTGADGAVALDVGKNDGDSITGLYVFQGSLFVFKRKKIYKISALSGTNPYDIGNLFVEEYSSSIGCVAAYTIKSILNDVLFLSDSGICSLVSAPLGELKTLYLSQNVKEIQKINKVSHEISAYVCEEAQQYWLMVPDTASPRNIYEIYVFDYRNIQSGLIRWIRFEGKIAGTVAETIYIAGQRVTLIGSQDFGVYFYRSGLFDFGGKWDLATWDISEWDNPVKYVFSDNGFSYEKKLITKAINFELPVIRKEFHRFAFNTTLLSNDLNLKVRYFFNKIFSKGGEYNFVYAIQNTASTWDVSLWDDGKWDEENKIDFLTIRQFKRNETGRKYQNVSLIFSNDLNQGFVLRQLVIYMIPLNHRQSNDIDRIV